MKRLFILCGGLLAWFVSNAANYTPLTCQGRMPEHMQRLLRSDKLDDAESDVRSMMSSGRVLYGTPINQYIDSIANILYKANPLSEHDKINIYLYKSGVTNAFMCKDGSLFVNMGLIAQASSEAEIALVLGHEMAHYVKKHSVQIDKKELRKSKDEVEMVLTKTRQSRENETEADSYAINAYYKNTNYSYEAIQGLFDLLQYGYLPFDEQPFDRDFVETADYKFPNDYYLTKLKPICSREDFVDTLSTHPNLKRRRELADNLVKNLDDTNRTEFMLSEATFDKVRIMARKEVVHQHLMYHNFASAFYNTYVMLASNPEDPELKTFAAQALYGLAKYASDGKLGDVLPSYKDAEGEVGGAYYFFKQMNKKELATLALRFAWDARKTNPDMDPYIKDLMRVIRNYDLSVSDYCDFAMGTSRQDAQKQVDAILGKNVQAEKKVEAKPTANTKTAKNTRSRGRRGIPAANAESSAETGKQNTVVEKKRDSKYDNIRNKQAREVYVLPDSSFTTLNYMLVDLKKDSSFVKMLAATEKSDEQKDMQTAIDAATNKKVAFDGGNALLVTYYFSDNKYAGKKDKMLQDNIIDWGRKNGINFICFEQNLKMNPNTQNYNLHTYVHDLQAQDIMEVDRNMVRIKNPRLDSVMNQQNITKVLDVKVSDKLEDKFSFARGLSAGIYMPIAMPVIVANSFTNKRDLKVVATLKDIETNNVDNSATLSVPHYNTQAQMHNFLYNFIYNIKRGK